MIYGQPTIGIDDANIFFSYAENILKGNGITYAGNNERVEGYTSTLWLLISALSFGLKFNEVGILIFSIILCLITSGLAIICICEYFSEDSKNWSYIAAVGYIILIAMNPAYIVWMSITLMDTVLWGLFLIMQVHMVSMLCTRRKVTPLVLVVICMAPLVRPESLLVTPILLGIAYVIRHYYCHNSDKEFFIKAAFGFISSTIALTVFRYIYFGYPLPNTFYAKVSPSVLYNVKEGLIYFSAFIRSNVLANISFFIVLIIFIIFIFDFYRVRKSPSLNNNKKFVIFSIISLTVLAAWLPIILSGGDHFAFYRFFQPIYPLLCIVFVISTVEIIRSSLNHTSLRVILFKNNNKLLGLVFIGIIFLGWTFSYLTNVTWVQLLTRAESPLPINYGIGKATQIKGVPLFRSFLFSTRTSNVPLSLEFAIANMGIDLGKTIDHIFVSTALLNPRVGTLTAGGVARSYSLTTDIMGLNNAFIAHFPGKRRGLKNHAAFEIEAFFKLDLDILFIDPTDSFSAETVFKGLMREERFINAWRYGRVSIRHLDNPIIEGFFNVNFIQKINQNESIQFIDTKVWDKENWSGQWIDIDK